jgi:U3 small nucleolar RNA-associated protein 23
MRHLYAAAKEPGVSYLIDKAKTYERRRCGHLPADHPEPLSATECITSVVDPKGTKHNKHRYVVASQDIEVRKAMRQVMGVPLVYINRSVMIMEPMAEATESVRDREEKAKFRDGLKGRASGSVGMKRKREEGGEEAKEGGGEEGKEKKKKKVFGGPKGPNPLSMKKSKKTEDGKEAGKKTQAEKPAKSEGEAPAEGAADGEKKKRRRKHKSGAAGGDAGGAAAGEPSQPAANEVGEGSD